MTTLVGGVGELYQGDLDLGRLAAERLAAEDLGQHVFVEELSYGAVAVAQRLEELRPELFVLVGAAQRGRPAGTVERREAAVVRAPTEDVQRAVADAVTGYVSVDLILDVARGFGCLPPRTIVIEVEPETIETAETLTPSAAAGLERALELVRAELNRPRGVA